MNYAESVWTGLSLVRERNPLVLNVTNNVVTNSTANALLALGASPAMTHAAEDAAELALLADALVLNIGTPAQDYVESMFAAGASARRKGIPVVLDPVAAGATAYRRNLALRLLKEVPPAVIRGNASEILFLAGEGASSKGADSTQESGAALAGARELARRLACTVCVSGVVDYVTDGPRVLAVGNGSALMTKVTGLGCTATAICAAFAAVNKNPFEAALNACVTMKAAGEIAAEKSSGPGTLQLHFYDALYNLSARDIAERCRLER